MQTRTPTTSRSPIVGDGRTLRRTTDDRVLAGVAGGLAERLRIDAVLVRVVFVVGSSLWGAGLLVYVALWFVVPEVDSPSANVIRPGMRPTRFRSVALAAVVGGVVVVARGWGVLPADRYLVPWLLVCAGVVVLWGRQPVRPVPRLALPPGPPATLLTDVDLDEPEPAPQPEPETAPPPRHGASSPQEEEPSPRRGGQPALVPIGTLTAGSLLVVCGMLYLCDDAGLVDVSWRLVGAVALTVIGLALVAGGWWGRPRGLILAGSGLALALLAATVVQVPVRGGVGRRDLRPAEVERVADEYRLAVGTILLDLRDVPLVGRRDVVASVAAGELRVLVPIGVEVDVDARTGFGEVVVFDRAGNGVGARRTFASQGGAPGRWVLDLDVGVGKVLVEQVR